MNWGLLSKYRDELYGISIIWIILFHGLEIKKTTLPKVISFLDPIIRHGNCGVEVFLFLSGVCLYFSLKKNFSIKSFYIKRLKRILLPFLLIDGVYWLYFCIYLKRDVLAFVKNISFYSFWIGKDKMVWFIALVLVLYLIYPLIFRVVDNNKYSLWIISVLIIASYVGCACLRCYFPKWFSAVEIALTRIPVFLIGCYVGRLVYEKKPISIFIKILTCIFFIYGLS